MRFYKASGSYEIEMGFITPEWSHSGRVAALTTTRTYGCSQVPYNSFNTALHVGDNPRHVAQNRAALIREIGHPIQWLNQVHGTVLAELDSVAAEAITADAAITRVPGVVCAVQTADCLPLLLCDELGTQVAAVHAGWRGLAAGIISKTLAAFDSPGIKLKAWLGPAISQEFFEVGDEVYAAFVSWAKQLNIELSQLDSAFKTMASEDKDKKKYMADLYHLARLELQSLGLNRISGGQACTWKDADQFYSYRRDGTTGRMASAIWIKP